MERLPPTQLTHYLLEATDLYIRLGMVAEAQRQGLDLTKSRLLSYSPWPVVTRYRTASVAVWQLIEQGTISLPLGDS
ncbi:MAG: hypothetical protein AAF921_19305 [Cyanobacteria bacterium P01_D01_bin.44]